MFSNKKTIQAFVTDKKLEERESVVFSQYYDLPNNQVLYWTLGAKQATTKLKIFSIDDFKTSIREQEFEGEYKLLGVLPNGTLLFNDKENLFDQKLITISSDTLAVLSVQSWKGAYSIGVIDNNHFFIINKSDNSGSHDKLARYVTIFQSINGVYVKQSETRLSVHPEYGETEIHSLGKNRYACHLRGHNTSEFRVLIFDIDPSTHQVKECGIITPARGVSHESAASGKCIALPNGNLLTYHRCDDHVQIWNTESMHCAKEWKWEEVKALNNFSVWCIKMTPLNDSIHLLVYQGNCYYLFNTEKLTMREIVFKDGFHPEYYGKDHVLADDRIILQDGRYNNKDYNQVLFKANTLLHYNEVMSLFKMSEVVAKRILSAELPAEMMMLVLSYAFTPEAESDFIKEAYNNPKRFNI